MRQDRVVDGEWHSIVARQDPKRAERVVVIIVSYGRPQDVVDCLAALSRSWFTAFEVILVENAGPGAFEGLAAELDCRWSKACVAAAHHSAADARLAGRAVVRSHSIQLTEGQPVLALQAHANLGYGGAVNLAIRCLRAQAGWRGLWILNPDACPDPEALGHIVEHAATGDYGLVGCRLVFADRNCVQLRAGGEWHWLSGRAVNIGYGEDLDQPVTHAAVEARLQWISGAALYATRAYVAVSGPMQEDYFLYCEDVEWSLRRGRFRLGYAHAAIVRHAHGSTIGSSSSKGDRSDLSVYLSQRNALLLTRDRAPCLFPLTAVTSLLWVLDLLVRGNRRVFIAACRGWWAGVHGRAGHPPVAIAPRTQQP